MELVLATNNKNKVREIKEILGNFFDKIYTLNELGFNEDIEETGSTFEENSLIKARAVSKMFNMVALADDSGLMVEALNGEPGVYSARYAGNHDDEANIVKLLENLKNETNRNAKFKTAICLYYTDDTYRIICGEVNGYITDKKYGESGFGYDPVFFSTELNKTFGEATLDEKNTVSHRSRALHKLKDILSK